MAKATPSKTAKAKNSAKTNSPKKGPKKKGSAKRGSAKSGSAKKNAARKNKRGPGERSGAGGKAPRDRQDAVAQGEARRKRQQAELARMESERQRALDAQRKKNASTAAPSKKRVRTVDKMRTARRTDAKLEADFKEAFEKRLDWGETAVAVVLMSEDWSIERNPATGAVVRRTFEVDIAGKKADGTIMVYLFLMQQESLGPNSWGKSGRSSHTALGYIEADQL